MFSAFRRPAHVHHPHSSSSHTGSSASGSVISGDSSSRAGSAIRSPDVSHTSYDSDAPPSSHHRHRLSRSAATSSGWESDTRKAVRWDGGARIPMPGSKQMVVQSSGYATDGPQRSEAGQPRSRTYSHSKSKLSTSSVTASSSNGDEFQHAVDRMLKTSTKLFAITGNVPLFAPIALFFNTPTSSCHVLRFPSEASIPSRTFDAFIAACEPIISPSIPSRSQPPAAPASHHTFRSTPNRPITPSFDIASHPILDTVKRVLFPNTPEGMHLIAGLSRVDVYCPGASSVTPKGFTFDGPAGAEDEPIAHVVVTLPVRFRGGMMTVTKDGAEERFWGRGTLSAGSSSQGSGGFAALSSQDKKIAASSLGNIEWVAYLGRGECEARVDKVEKGVRINLVYDVWMRSYGLHGPVPHPLLTPNDSILAALSSVLKRSRGMKLAFYMTNDYGISPSHVLAESVVPSLKGSDLALYHALKFYNLQPAMRYTAGGFIWPAASYATIVSSPQFLEAMKRVGLKSAGEDEDLTIQIEDGGGVPLEREGIVIVTGKEQGRIGRERVAFVEARESKLEYLHVNVCMVVYVH